MIDPYGHITVYPNMGGTVTLLDGSNQIDDWTGVMGALDRFSHAHPHRGPTRDILILVQRGTDTEDPAFKVADSIARLDRKRGRTGNLANFLERGYCINALSVRNDSEAATTINGRRPYIVVYVLGENRRSDFFLPVRQAIADSGSIGLVVATCRTGLIDTAGCYDLSVPLSCNIDTMERETPEF